MRPLSACIACRDRRKKCNRSRPGVSCEFCIRRGLECSVPPAPVLADATSTQAKRKSYEPLHTGSAEEGRGRNVSSVVIPDAALCEELVELYFRHAHIAFHNIFHRASLIARVRDTSIPKILFFGIASLSARYSRHPVFGTISPWDRGRPYRDETKRLLDLEDTSIESIQACMLLASGASVEGDNHAESVYLAVALRMATLLDLPTLPTESLLEQEINRRVWWSLISIETWTSAAQSLPRIIRPRDSVPLPMDERLFAALDYDVPVAQGLLDEGERSFRVTDPSSGSASDSMVAQMIRLNMLLYEIVLLNARLVAEQVESIAAQKRSLQLAQVLESWAANLSPELRYTEDNLTYWADEGLGPMLLTLHINYNHAGQLLFYQALDSAWDEHQPPLFSADTARLFAQKCKGHATNLCDLMHRARRRPETAVMYPLAGHILCLASTVQIHTLLFDGDEREIQAAKTRLEQNFEIISSMNEYWPMNHMTTGRLQRFHTACLRSKDDSFRLDAWMLRFLLGFSHDIEDRDAVWEHGPGSPMAFDSLRQLLDI